MKMTDSVVFDNKVPRSHPRSWTDVLERYPIDSGIWRWNQKGIDGMQKVDEVKQVYLQGVKFIRSDLVGIPKIKRVIYSGPATIVLWDDNTKTVVKCQEGDTWNPEMGVLECIAKKAYGNKSNYNNIIQAAVAQGIADAD